MRAGTSLVLAVVLAACSSPADDPTGTPGPGGDGPDLRSDKAPPPDPGARRCSGLSRPAADQQIVLATPDGRMRVAEVHVPKRYDPTLATPLVLNLHGFSSNPWEEELLSGMKQRSEDRDFILVYPKGSGQGLELLSWNGPICCPVATTKNVDDVGFIQKLIDHLAGTLCIDPRRVYATGMSNGGFMSHRLGCELSDRIAAIAPVAGQMALPQCQPRRPVPVMHFHGTKDQLVPYLGGKPAALGNLPTDLIFPSVAQTIAAWVRADGCGGAPRTILTLPDARCESYEGCQGGAQVTLCTVDGGGHTWPGGSMLADTLLGYTSKDLHATDLMLDFFQAHPMP